jgi:hypothetical protein
MDKILVAGKNTFYYYNLKTNLFNTIRDSGGSLAIFENGQYVLVGITSFGMKGQCSGHTSAFVKVSSYLEWIHEKSAGAVSELIAMKVLIFVAIFMKIFH